MFIGHFAPAFVAASITARRPKAGPGLATFFVAAVLVDCVFFVFAFSGIEKIGIAALANVTPPYDLYSHPFTHSLLGTGLWALGFGAIIASRYHDLVSGMLAALVVASHWLLDWITHSPGLTLTLTGAGDTYGLGLEQNAGFAIALEIAITLAAFVFYIKSSRGPIVQPTLLMTFMLGLQMVIWLISKPEIVGWGFYAEALIAFAILVGLAFWTGENRYFMQRSGLASASR